MYKISIQIGQRTVQGEIPGSNLSPEEIQTRGWGILGPHVADLLPKGKGVKLPEIQYQEITEAAEVQVVQPGLPISRQDALGISTNVLLKAEEERKPEESETEKSEELSIIERLERLEAMVFGKKAKKEES